MVHNMSDNGIMISSMDKVNNTELMALDIKEYLSKEKNKVKDVFIGKMDLHIKVIFLVIILADLVNIDGVMEEYFKAIGN